MQFLERPKKEKGQLRMPVSDRLGGTLDKMSKTVPDVY